MNPFKNFSFLMMTAALLSSCQRAASFKTTTYQEKTTATLAKMANTINKPLRAARAAAPKVTNLLGIGGIYDFAGSSPYGGNFFTNNPQDLMSTCMQMQDALRTTISDDAALAKIYQCGMALVSFQNPAFTMANRQLSSAGLAYNGYNNAYAGGLWDWGSYAQYYPQNQGYFNQYQQYGFVPNGQTFSQ